MEQQADVTSNIGRSLKVWRAECGMTQADVAEAIGISPQQYQKYEAGSSRLEMSRMFDICRVLGKSPGQLLRYGEANADETVFDSSSVDSPGIATDLAPQVDLSFQISEVVSAYMALPTQADKEIVLNLIRRLSRQN